MSPGHSVTAWIQQLKAGEEEAIAPLFRRYWPMLVTMARRRLGDLRCSADEDDVAQEAIWGFFRAIRKGQVPRLENRQDLLALLTHIITCRALNQIKREVGVAKRDRGRLQAMPDREGANGVAGMDQVASKETTPGEQALLADCYEHYLQQLPERLHRIAELHLAGLTNREIAAQLDCAERSVERKLALLREHWEELAAQSLAES